LSDLGGELDQSDRSDVDAKSGQRSIQIVPGESSFSAAASQRGRNLDL
jgi:precorrin-6B methylase 1